MTPVVRLAPAKLNLTLAVVGRRDDGYHDLHSVMAPLALADRLSLAPDPSPAPATASASWGFDAGPAADNLVLRAIARRAAALRPHGREPPPALAVRLDKRIPVAAGLAGGSSDAAAADRRRARGVGRGRLDATSGRARSRLDRVRRAVLPRGRPGARRGARRAGHAAARLRARASVHPGSCW